MGFGGSAPTPPPPPVMEETKKRTTIDPSQDEKMAEAARRRAEILKRIGRNKLRTDDTREKAQGGQTRGGTTY